MRRLLNSFRYAYRGLLYVFRSQQNIWIHLAFTIIVILVGILVKLDAIRWGMIVFCFALVWISEIINTAIEVLINLVSPQPHPLAKTSKDISAAAVLLAALAAVVIGIIVFISPLIALLKTWTAS